jgi:hypothetical protein
MSPKKETPKKRGPKGGIKHQPGRGHDRKSLASKKKRFARKVSKKRLDAREDSMRAWAEWDALSDEVKQLLGPSAQPQLPRPEDG